jgi:serine/threonine protein kinase
MSPEIIAGRYAVVRAIGHGGMGTVWLCRDEVLGREVAVKQVGVLPGESVPDLARALREARSSAALNHPHVVSVFDAVEADDHIWLVMEYVPGSTLSELIAREGRLDPARVASIGAQVADGLAAAHARGTVHRDVKPGNILIDGELAKISDFGIARTAGDAQLTQTGLLMGTPLYFSPELARGADPSPAADVWALGASLYAAVEGAPPFEDRGNPIATVTAIAGGTVPPPVHAGVLTDAIGRMLDPDPVSRWSMADAAHALHRLQSQPASPPTFGQETPVVEEPPPPDDRRRSRAPWLVAALVVLLLAGIAAVALAALRDDPGTAADRPATSPSRTPQKSSSAPAPSSDAPPEASEPPASEATEPVATGGAEETVEAYYGRLPDDTEAAWEYLGPAARASAGGYDDYAAFWNTIDSVTVDGTGMEGDVVYAELTYNGDDSETRALRMAQTDDGWVISEDLGP